MWKIICLSGDMLIVHGIDDAIFYEPILYEMDIDEIPFTNDMDTIKTIVFYPDESHKAIMEGVVYDVKYETKTHLLIISNRGDSIIPKCRYKYEEVYINDNLEFIDNL